MANPADPRRVRGLILAGGRSSRFGANKAFALLHGRPLLQHVIDRLAPQVDALAVNAPPDARFAAFGLPVLPDARADLHGPLAGLYTAFATWPDDEIVVVAVDLPFLPRDLVARLRAARGAPCVYAGYGKQHALALWCAPGGMKGLASFVDARGTSLKGWLEDAACVDFPADEDSDISLNINTPEDLRRAEQRFRGI